MIEPLSNMIAVVPAILPSEGVSASTVLPGAVLNLNTYGSDRVLMVVTFGPIAGSAATSIKAQCAAVLAFTTPLDIVGSSQTVADNKDDLTFMIDVINPLHPYVRVYVSRATQVSTVASAYYLVYGMRNRPYTQTIEGVEVHRDKGTGTA